MNAYEEAQRILFDSHYINAKCDNFRNGPISFGRIKGKCVILQKMNDQEYVRIPRYAHKYKYLIVVYCKHAATSGRRSNRFDDIFVYSIKELKASIGRSNGFIDFRKFPLALSDEMIASLGK